MKSPNLCVHHCTMHSVAFWTVTLSGLGTQIAIIGNKLTKVCLACVVPWNGIFLNCQFVHSFAILIFKFIVNNGIDFEAR